MSMEELAEAVVAAQPLDATERRVAFALYRLLGRGMPVAPEALAREAGADAREVIRMLDRWPGVFRDGDGRIVAFWGLALRKMAHRLEFDGRTLYAWCAWDTLFLPQILGVTARVDSRCPVTHEPVSLTVGPDGPREVSPPGMVLSFLRPSRDRFGKDAITTFCDFVHFFSTRDAGERWTVEHPGTFLLSLKDAVALARGRNVRLFAELLDPSRGAAAR